MLIISDLNLGVCFSKILMQSSLFSHQTNIRFKELEIIYIFGKVLVHPSDI